MATLRSSVSRTRSSLLDATRSTYQFMPGADSGAFPVCASVSPVTNSGCWIFGAGIGLLVVLIRIWGGLAEGVMYAILIMNAFVPYLNRWTQPRVFGTRRLTART